jgi:hypothetical protein
MSYVRRRFNIISIVVCDRWVQCCHHSMARPQVADGGTASRYGGIKSRLKSGNACYHSVQNLLSSSLLSKSVKIKIYRTIILPVVLYGCELYRSR